MKKTVTFIIINLLLATSFINAQSWQWAKTAGGASADISGGIAVDASGNTYVTGNFGSSSITFGSTTLTSHGGLDFYIVKYDPAGNVLWAKGASGVSNEGGYNLTLDASGNIYVVGTTNSSSLAFGTTTLSLHGYDDVFIVKYDNSGNVLWAKMIGGSDNDIGENISVDAMGNAYITGYFASSSIAFGSTTLTNVGGNDFFIAKYDASGNALWAKTAGGTGNELGLGIASDAIGNTYVTGNFASASITFGSTTLTNHGGLDFYIVKYNTSGTVLWAKGATGVSNDGGYNLALDTIGNIYLIGSTNSSSLTFGTTALTLHGYDDFFVVKYDLSGNLLWAKIAGGSANDVGQSISVDDNGTSYVTGYFASTSLAIGTTTLSNTGTNSVFVASYDANGNAQWAKSAGGTSDDRGNSIAIDPNGNNAYVTGNHSSPFISFGTTSLNNAGSGNDVFVAKLAIATTGIKENSELNSSIVIAPNPNNGVFELQIKDMKNLDSEIQVSITNLLGQQVFETKQNTSSITIKLDNIGVYFVTVKSGKYSSTKKLIVN